MPFTVTHNFITLYDMESLTGWTGPASLTLNTDINRQGTACIGWLADTAATPVWGPAFAARDLSSPVGDTRVIWTWFNVIDYYDLDWGYNGGIQLLMEDSVGNQAYWYISGHPNSPNDNRRYSGGWSQIGLDTTNAPAGYLVGTSIDMTQIVRLGFAVRKTSASTSLAQDSFIDWCFLDSTIEGGQIGPTIYGLNDVDGQALQEAADALQAADIGILKRYGKGYILSSRLNIGTTDGVNPTRFIARGESLACRREGAIWALQGIIVTGALGSETVFELGETIGTYPDDKGINGGFTSGPESPMAFNVFNSYVSGGVYGTAMSMLSGWGASNPNNANFVFLNSQLNILGSFFNSQLPRIENCVIYGGDQASFGAIRYNTTASDINLKNTDFVNNQGALGFDSAGSYTLDNVRFFNNTYDIVNRSGGNITINAINGSNPDPLKVNNVSGGSVTIINSVPVTVRVIDLDNGNAPVPLAQASIYDLSRTELLNADTDSAGLATTTYNYQGADVSVVVKVRKSSPGDVRYENFSTNATITSTGLDITVGLRRDTKVDPNL